MQVLGNQQQAPKRSSTARFVFIYGTLIGLIPGILYIIVTLLNVYPALSTMLWVLLAVYGVGFFLAGILAVQKTGKISIAVLAGLWSGVVGGCLSYAYIFASLLLQPLMIVELSHFLVFTFNIQLTPYNALTMNLSIQIVVIALMIAFLLTLVLSICLSLLGGIVSRMSLRKYSYSQFNHTSPKG